MISSSFCCFHDSKNFFASFVFCNFSSSCSLSDWSFFFVSLRFPFNTSSFFPPQAWKLFWAYDSQHMFSMKIDSQSTMRFIKFTFNFIWKSLNPVTEGNRGNSVLFGSWPSSTATQLWNTIPNNNSGLRTVYFHGVEAKNSYIHFAFTFSSLFLLFFTC